MTASKTNHPGRRKSAPKPAGALLAAARAEIGDTQTEAAQRCYRALRTWQENEAASHCDPAVLELYLLKTGLIVRGQAWTDWESR